jgi:two-component system OmpR family response regulator
LRQDGRQQLAASHKEVEVSVMKENRPRVLVVDNVADAADCLALLLRLWGYDAEACYGGAAALEVARADRPQAVLLDVGMPGMDGFQVAQRLRAQPGLADTVVIGITGYGDEACRTQARAVGFDHYLLKPVEPDHLRELLAGAASGRAGCVTPNGMKQQDGAVP